MGLTNYRHALTDQLEHYAPFDAREDDHRRSILSFLANCADPFHRGNERGHVTASAFLVSDDHDRVLVLWHEKLRRWLQPGGHTEDSDESPQAAALRELVEETGLDRARFRPAGDSLFDLDVHLIPAMSGAPEHYHYDLRYLFQLTADPGPEGGPFRWVKVDELVTFEDESLARPGRKLLRPAGIRQAGSQYRER